MPVNSRFSAVVLAAIVVLLAVLFLSFATSFGVSDCTDNDGDGYGVGTGCLGPDCDDNDRFINPGAVEVPGDGIDQNCDGLEACYVDADGDGYGNSGGTTVASASLACADAGQASTSTDCDDDDAGINPAAPEICDGLDNNCDGSIDEGNPGGGWSCGTDVGECVEGTTQCVAGTLICKGSVGPTVEICDGLDNDCNGATDDGLPDVDGDGIGDACDTTGYVVEPRGLAGLETKSRRDDSFLDEPALFDKDGEFPVVAGRRLWATYQVGDPISGGFALLPDDDSSRRSVYEIDLYKLDTSTATHTYVRVGRTTARFHRILECFRFIIRTGTLAPGYYDVILRLPDATRIRVRIELTAADGSG